MRYRKIKDLPREELFAPGHTMCAGCGPALAVRWITKFIGKNAIIVNATGCVEVTTTIYPHTAWEHPYIHSLFENASAVASGIESAIKILSAKGRWKHKGTKVVVIAGDGGTYDIGLQSLSGMLERAHKVIYILYDNEAYMNTGIQRSGATPPGAWTTTTPSGKKEKRKDIIAIVLAHKIPYVATASISHITDLGNKIQRALEFVEKGPVFIRVFAPCVPGWRYPESKTVRIARLAVETGYFPLLEWIEGKLELNPPSKYHLDPKKRKPLAEFLKMQERFQNTKILPQLENEVNQMWEEIARFLKNQNP